MGFIGSFVHSSFVLFVVLGKDFCMKRYSEALVKKIIGAIKNGSSMSKIYDEFGVKTEKTVQRWLDQYYTIQKKRITDVLVQLRVNNQAEEESAGKLEMVADNINSEWFYDEMEPLVDYLVDRWLAKATVKKVIACIEAAGKTYKMSKSSQLNIEAICLGYPIVVTDNETYKSYLDWDNVEYVDPEKMQMPFEEEIKEFEWSKPENFPFKVRKDGATYGFVEEIIKHFAQTRGVEFDSVTVYKNKKELKHNTIFLDEGDELIFISDSKECICWTFKFSGKSLREIGYKKGDSSCKEAMLSA